MAKATVTLLRQLKASKPLGIGGMTISEAFVHFNTSPMTVHANDVRLRRLTSLVLFPLTSGGSSVYLAEGSIVGRANMNNLASIAIRKLGTLTTGILPDNGSMKISAGSKQDYYGIFIGD